MNFKYFLNIIKFFFLNRKNKKKVAISSYLSASKFNFYGKKLNEKFDAYKKDLIALNTENLWVENNLNIILNLFDEFTEYKEKKINILELGSYQGASAFLFLKLLKNSTITCVDSFDVENNYRIFKKNLDVFSENRLVVNKLSTLSFFAKEMKKSFYDIIYIDAGHGYSDLTIDIYCSFDQVVNGGIVIFDDYEWNDRNLMSMDKNVRLAINDFLKRANGCYEVLHHGYIVILKKIRDFNGFQIGENYYKKN